MTEPLRRTTGHEGGASLPVAPGGNAVEGSVQYQLEKGEHAGAGDVSREVPRGGLHLAGGCADSQGRNKVIQVDWTLLEFLWKATTGFINQRLTMTIY